MKSEAIDQLIEQAVFAESKERRAEARAKIYQQALARNIVPASIHDFYLARAQERLPLNFTVPAFNLRGMTYLTARAAFKAALDQKVGAMIFELAASEMVYTAQTPAEYLIVIMAAALREGWTGPLFIQGDHFQAKASQPGVPVGGQIEGLKNLISEALSFGFYNIDLDMSTLVDLDQVKVEDQQQPNSHYTALLTEYIRQQQPAGATVSVGGEIGHIGGKNSTVEDLRAFLDQYLVELAGEAVGLSKISVQTGSHHGGVVKADGTLADLDIDFSVLSTISHVARQEYQVAGAVQHGASTLPDEYLGKFARHEAIEVHLATGFQNLIMDHEDFPAELLAEIYDWLAKNKKAELQPDWTTDQFNYKLRKKAWGPFKKQLWQLPSEAQSELRTSLVQRFSQIFEKLNVTQTQALVRSIIKPVPVTKTREDFLTTSVISDQFEQLAD